MNSLLGTVNQGVPPPSSNLSRPQGKGSLLGACPQPVDQPHHQQHQINDYNQQFQGLPAPLIDGCWNNGFGISDISGGNALFGSMHFDGLPGVHPNHGQIAMAKQNKAAQRPASSSILGSVNAREYFGQEDAPMTQVQPLLGGGRSLLGSICSPNSATPQMLDQGGQLSMQECPYFFPGNHNAVSRPQEIASSRPNAIHTTAGPSQMSSLLGAFGGTNQEDNFLAERHQQFSRPGQPIPLIPNQPGHVAHESMVGANNSILGSAAPDTGVADGMRFRYLQAPAPMQQPGMEVQARNNNMGMVPTSIPSLLGPLAQGPTTLHNQANCPAPMMDLEDSGQAFGNLPSSEANNPMDPLFLNGRTGGPTTYTVAVENLPFSLSADELKSVLYSCCTAGPPLEVLVSWPGSGRLIFNDASVAVATTRFLDGQKFHGHILRVYLDTYPPEVQNAPMLSYQ